MRARRRMVAADYRGHGGVSWEEAASDGDDDNNTDRDHRGMSDVEFDDDRESPRQRNHRQRRQLFSESEEEIGDSSNHEDDAYDDHRSAASSSYVRPPPTRPMRVSIPWQALFSPAPKTPAKEEHRQGEAHHGDGGGDDYDDDGYFDHDSPYYTSDDYCSGDDGTDNAGRALRNQTANGLHHRRGRADSTSKAGAAAPAVRSRKQKQQPRGGYLSTPVAMPPSSSVSPFRTSPMHQHRGAGTLSRPNLQRGSSHSSSPSKSKGRRHWCSVMVYRCRNVRSVLIGAALLYLLLVLHVYRRVSSQHDANNHIMVLSYQLEKRRMARSYLHQKLHNQVQNVRAAAQQRAVRRRAVARPSQYRPDPNNESPMGLHLARARAVDVAPSTDADGSVPDEVVAASMEELCGFYAQNASLAHPSLFPRRHSLTASSNARVLITGILNPVGANLALTLKERCGVRSIVGIDHLFPNTVATRLNALPVMEMLHHRLGAVLERPILAAHVALEPRASGISSKDAAYLEAFNDGTAATHPWLDLVATFRPTHIVHLASYAPEAYRTSIDERSPASPEPQQDVAALYSVRSSLTSMEHILQSIANAPVADRPAFVYASSSSSSLGGARRGVATSATVLHNSARAMDEALAKSYAREFGVHSLAIRVPNAVFGPWGHVDSATHKILQDVVSRPGDGTSVVPDVAAVPSSEALDLLYVGNVVEGLVAAMQFRPARDQALAFELAPAASIRTADFLRTAKALFAGSKTDKSEFAPAVPLDKEVAGLSREFLDWSPSTPLGEGLVRTLAWHFDQVHPYGLCGLARNLTSSDALLSGEALLQRHTLSTCQPDDVVCHGGAHYFPCASECSTTSRCTPSVFDSIIPLVHEVFDGCDAVMYTQALGIEGELTLETEYMDEGNPLVCTVAFVSFESAFVQGVVKKVPDSELAKLGVSPRHEDGGTPESIHKLKHKKLNGRLLYLGWLLVWPDAVVDSLSHADHNLLKLSPGRLFPPEVKFGIFIEQSFGASPRSDDAIFLINSMVRPASPMQLVKNKNPPKAKFQLPPEPEKRAVLLMSELRRQESPKTRVHSTSRLSVKQASRYMRYEVGEHPLGKESLPIKQHREFYERVMTLVNSNFMRSSSEPVYKLEFRHVSRTRWVVHDMQLEEGRQLRCDWYREHLQWEQSPLDQLSFAYVLAKREVERRIAHREADDRIRARIADQIELKTLLTDVFEWHALQTEANRQYKPLSEIRSLPYNSMDDLVRLREDDHKSNSSEDHDFLFARIISDRTLAAARKEWTVTRKESNRRTTSVSR